MLSRKTILLVEDDDDLLEFAGDLLHKLGYQVVKAPNAESAFGIIESDQVHLDLLLSDIRLPGSANGIELAERAVSLRPALKVLLTSGYDDYFIHKNVNDQFPFLEKPYYPSTLDQALRAAFVEVAG
jgi:DNA-binding NtrC family response regulator